ncbi:vascular endothelial growth factor A-A isoform X4 [Rhinichthys klamathensis goyatoka]|uniref:vascular endothelial growth factor A-A isoform X4 n=1 Tax=Pimephales promelas TaxID=90988 RepID=UPI001955C18E|nr:vascular endothelial growth factor A-A isoform X4 [Pimephales promelas]XP_056114312.1 vascular endothelial growth factor A-A isoform X4 [Rhinichthys klamathensis goyatoka]
MNFVVYSIQLFFAALLHLSAVKAAHIPKEGGKSKNDVIPFLDVYKKSACKTRELLVDIIQEYPDEIEHTYIPSCVVLMRCAGCCNDEALECVPTETRNVTMEVLRVKQRVSQHNFQMSFTEHTKCECRPKAEVKAKKEKKPRVGRVKSRKRAREGDTGDLNASAHLRSSTTVSLAQREESACMCRTPSPVNAPANSHNCNASPDNLS